MERMSNRWERTDAPRGEEYDARWERLAKGGKSIHGEADLIDALLDESGGRRILDAGCGTGRVAIELSRRGYPVLGVDADERMLATARTKAPEIRWLTADLGELEEVTGETFDVVVLAGNVMIFLEPGTEQRVVAQIAQRLAPGALLVAGFSIKPRELSLETYDELTAAAGLSLVHRWSTWGREPYAGGDYAVSVHRRPVPGSGDRPG